MADHSCRFCGAGARGRCGTCRSEMFCSQTCVRLAGLYGGHDPVCAARVAIRETERATDALSAPTEVEIRREQEKLKQQHDTAMATLNKALKREEALYTARMANVAQINQIQSLGSTLVGGAARAWRQFVRDVETTLRPDERPAGWDSKRAVRIFDDARAHTNALWTNRKSPSGVESAMRGITGALDDLHVLCGAESALKQASPQEQIEGAADTFIDILFAELTRDAIALGLFEDDDNVATETHFGTGGGGITDAPATPRGVIRKRRAAYDDEEYVQKTERGFWVRLHEATVGRSDAEKAFVTETRRRVASRANTDARPSDVPAKHEKRWRNWLRTEGLKPLLGLVVVATSGAVIYYGGGKILDTVRAHGEEVVQSLKDVNVEAAVASGEIDTVRGQLAGTARLLEQKLAATNENLTVMDLFNRNQVSLAPTMENISALGGALTDWRERVVDHLMRANALTRENADMEFLDLFGSFGRRYETLKQTMGTADPTQWQEQWGVLQSALQAPSFTQQLNTGIQLSMSEALAVASALKGADETLKSTGARLDTLVQMTLTARTSFEQFRKGFEAMRTRAPISAWVAQKLSGGSMEVGQMEWMTYESTLRFEQFETTINRLVEGTFATDANWSGLAFWQTWFYAVSAVYTAAATVLPPLMRGFQLLLAGLERSIYGQLDAKTDDGSAHLITLVRNALGAAATGIEMTALGLNIVKLVFYLGSSVVVMLQSLMTIFSIIIGSWVAMLIGATIITGVVVFLLSNRVTRSPTVHVLYYLGTYLVNWSWVIAPVLGSILGVLAVMAPERNPSAIVTDTPTASLAELSGAKKAVEAAAAVVNATEATLHSFIENFSLTPITSASANAIQVTLDKVLHVQ